MDRRMQRSGVAMLATLLVINTGCLTTLKHAYYEVQGAQAEEEVIESAGSAALATYKGVEFLPSESRVPAAIVPATVRAEFDRQAKDAAAKLAPEYPGGAPRLAVDTEIFYFQRTGIMSAGMLLMRARFRDQNRVIVDLLVKSESKSFRAGGEEDLVAAGLEAIIEYLKKQKPPAETKRESAGDEGGG